MYLFDYCIIQYNYCKANYSATQICFLNYDHILFIKYCILKKYYFIILCKETQVHSILFQRKKDTYISAVIIVTCLNAKIRACV